MIQQTPITPPTNLNIFHLLSFFTGFYLVQRKIQICVPEVVHTPGPQKGREYPWVGLVKKDKPLENVYGSIELC